MSRVPRGAALLLVMWLILLLSGLVAGYAMAARIESMQGNGLARGTTAREAARAGVEYATARMLDPDPERRWAADGRDYRFAFDGAQVEISVRDELIAWYERRGYSRTGKYKPFPYGDERFGIPKRDDLRFEVLSKVL